MFYMSYIPCEIFANIEKFCRRSRPTTKSYASISNIFCMEPIVVVVLVHSSCETIHCFLTDVLCESGRTAHA